MSSIDLNNMLVNVRCVSDVETTQSDDVTFVIAFEPVRGTYSRLNQSCYCGGV